MAFIEPMHRNKPNITYLLDTQGFSIESGQIKINSTHEGSVLNQASDQCHMCQNRYMSTASFINQFYILLAHGSTGNYDE